MSVDARDLTPDEREALEALASCELDLEIVRAAREELAELDGGGSV